MTVNRPSAGPLRALTVVALLLLSAAALSAQTARSASHLRPSGKGWGVEDANAPAEQEANGKTVVQGNGISYHGGPVMTASSVNVYFIWYGNWNQGGSNSPLTQSLLQALFSSSGLNKSGYENINTTYGDNSANVSGSLMFIKETSPGYSHGKKLTDSTVQQIVADAINAGTLPKDANGLYFVLTSSDVSERSGFCSRYCGWHTNGSIGGTDIKYSFVGNPDRCPNACEAQTTSPNNDSGADGMASIMAHESEEAISDPDGNAWYDSVGNENADKCAWKFGPTSRASNGSAYNQTLAGYSWLIQMNWENARGGGCDQKLGGTFYTQ
jgi:hypothetical protein